MACEAELRARVAELMARVAELEGEPMAVAIPMPEPCLAPVYLIGPLGHVEHSEVSPSPPSRPPFGRIAALWERFVFLLEASFYWYRGRLWAARAQLPPAERERRFGSVPPEMCGFP